MADKKKISGNADRFIWDASMITVHRKGKREAGKKTAVVEPPKNKAHPHDH